jgi:DMSO/TMAO reductase YedYZ heme-binding membrane subunit
MTPQFWWYAARSTGIVAWGLSAAAVIWGLLLSTRSARGLAKPAWVLDLHRWLGALTIVVTLAHLGALVADSYVQFDLVDLLVPGASGWKTGAVAWGVVAFWAFLAVEVSSLLKKRLPHKAWVRIHLLSFAAYVMVTMHYLTAGTERTNPLVLFSVEIVTAIVLFLTLLRILAPRRAKGASPRKKTTRGSEPASELATSR